MTGWADRHAERFSNAELTERFSDDTGTRRDLEPRHVGVPRQEFPALGSVGFEEAFEFEPRLLRNLDKFRFVLINGVLLKQVFFVKAFEFFDDRFRTLGRTS